MAALTYFVPGTGAIKKDKIVELGFEYLTKEADLSFVAGSGNGGSQGVLFTYGKQIDINISRWVDLDGIYLGINDKEKPNPKELEREDFSGQVHIVKMNDGQEWEIPVVRCVFGGDSPLGKRITYNKETDEWEDGEILDKYKAIFDLASEVWDVISDDINKIDMQKIYKLAGESLKLRYRISNSEINELDLFSSTCATEACLAAIDIPTYEDFVKKNPAVLEEQSLEDGETESSEITPQPLAS